MKCKNCLTPQRTDFNYCPKCGAKVVHKRITFSNLIYDITERYFNLDNSLVRTFVQLFSRPEVVIESYLGGVRRKYLNPISYIGIALTLSGLMLFLMSNGLASDLDWDLFDQGTNPELYKKILPIIYDYSSFIFILYIPVFAVSAYLTFNRKSLYFSELVVAFVYILAHWSILSFPVTLGLLIIQPEAYVSFSLVFLLAMFGYAVFVLQRINRFSTGQFILRLALFGTLSFIGYMGIIMAFYVLLFVTGTITLEDFRPVQ